MPRKDVRWPFLPLFLLLQALTIVTVAISLPDSVSLLNSTIHSISPAPFNNTALNDSTLPRTSLNTIDYYIIGTALLLRITETGRPFSEAAVNEIMDAAIHEVVRKINAGAGKDKILHDSFAEITPAIELRIKALEDARLTYFLLGERISLLCWLMMRIQNEIDVSSLVEG